MIKITGAREHNLKDISLEIPRDKLVVITGKSGSGKSSLAFDTIYQEGQRRFMESLSAYARQFLGQMHKPSVDSIEGLSPTICIDQKTVNRNPRSTVGTTTEILDHFRLLMSRLGEPKCPECGHHLRLQSPDQLIDNLLATATGKRLQIMAPIVQDRKGEYRKELIGALQNGYLRARIDGEIRSLEEDISLARYEKHTIELIVDRMKCVEKNRDRMIEAAESALRLGKGILSVMIGDLHQVLSSKRTCPIHGISAPEMEPRLFSFNAPQGMCMTCNGLGFIEGFDLDLLLDKKASILDVFRPMQPEGRLPFTSLSTDRLKVICKKLKIRTNKKWTSLTKEEQEKILYGDANITYLHKRKQRQWIGLINIAERVWRFTRLPRLNKYRNRATCSDCNGSRLNPLALAVTFRGKTIDRFVNMSVDNNLEFFSSIALTQKEKLIGTPILRELIFRLQFLKKVGLGYLTINRSASTLSGGEAQRIRLATQIGSGLQGVTYILDEPSIGLHQRDQNRLIDALIDLKNKGNSIIVVEHDPLTMLRSDYLIEVGPGSGQEGGHIVYANSKNRFLRSSALTAKYLRGELGQGIPSVRRESTGDKISIYGAQENNLKNIDISFPLQTLTVVTGVSGSGKSTLIEQTLYRAISQHLFATTAKPGKFDKISGLEHIDKLIMIDQSPIGRTPRSNPATYTGVMTPIRELFCQTIESRRRGYTKSRFSFNVAPEKGGGRCEECQGAGQKVIEMQFLSNVHITCEACNGLRFNQETLDILYKGKRISDVLAMSIQDAAVLFQNHKKISRILNTLLDVGLGYLSLGQPSTTLSGGEAQRIKLAAELQKPATGKTFYILDEPTTGLHMADVEKLIDALQALVDKKNTVVVIEHDVDVIKAADYVIDLGPEGGEKGGKVIGKGTPEEIAKLNTPTGQVLKKVLHPENITAQPDTKWKRQSTKAKHPNVKLYGVGLHNLRNVNAEFQQGKMTVVTGPSGSGKSSLAFHTLFSEGQRRYVESLSTYARRFLGRLPKPPLEKAEGLAPAIAIDQQNKGYTPRSTVATSTEIHDLFRILFSKIATPHCYICQRELKAFSPTAAAKYMQRHIAQPGWITAQMTGSVSAGELMASGYTRLWTQEKEIEMNDPQQVLTDPTLVIDRCNPKRATRQRLADAISQAYQLGKGKAQFIDKKTNGSIEFTKDVQCLVHGFVLPETITPRHLSFNTRVGSCTNCDGLGIVLDIDPQKLFPKPHNAIWDAIDGRVKISFGRSKRIKNAVNAVLRLFELSPKEPVQNWPQIVTKTIIYGYPKPLVTTAGEIEWEGFGAMINRWQSEATWLRKQGPCGLCNGKRLKPQVLGLRIAGKNIADVAEQTVDTAFQYWKNIDKILTPNQTQIAKQPIQELISRLSFLSNVGLGYMQLDRSSRTLSGGEAQRIRLASQLGSKLTRTIYVLDEPTIGLHPRDTKQLLSTLKGLRDRGNTLVLVEHDREVISAADHLIDMGPAAGEHGGSIVATGAPHTLPEISLTGQYLSGKLKISRPKKRRKPSKWIQLKNVKRHNIDGIDIRFPRNCFTVVTGVSGSGKSTLVMDILAAHLAKRIEKPNKTGIQKLAIVDQRPLSRSPRSSPVSYCKILDGIRDLYANTKLAKVNGWTKNRFSYNAAAGRCQFCEGRGATLIEMHFLSDVWVPCEACNGSRFNDQTLSVYWNGLNIADVLNLPVSTALSHFENHKGISNKLKALQSVGLGYLRLGQPVNQLSGGEAQRVKLAKELALGRRAKETCFILDEPTTGLHDSDVQKLITAIHQLVDAGHMVVMVEHNIDVILNADHVIDLGPEGGSQGGKIIFQGAPEKLLKTTIKTRSHTAKAILDREKATT